MREKSNWMEKEGWAELCPLYVNGVFWKNVKPPEGGMLTYTHQCRSTHAPWWPEANGYDEEEEEPVFGCILSIDFELLGCKELRNGKTQLSYEYKGDKLKVINGVLCYKALKHSHWELINHEWRSAKEPEYEYVTAEEYDKFWRESEPIPLEDRLISRSILKLCFETMT